MKRLLLLFSALFFFLVSSAYDFEVDGIYYNKLSSTTVEVTNTPYYTEYAGTVVLPETVYYSGKYYLVSSIGNSAFRDCRGLTSITISNSVTSIGDFAFSCCSGLNSITIPNSVTSIGNWAFSYCSGLTSITISNSVTSIGICAFSYCSGLTSITIPNSVTSIADGAFCYCSSLRAFYGKYASNDKKSLIVDGTLKAIAPVELTNYTVPESVTSIGSYVFIGCNGLTSVIIPSTVTFMGNETFRSCCNLSSITCYVDNPLKITLWTSVFGEVPTETCTLYVPYGSKTLYRAADQWKAFANIQEILPEIPESFIVDGINYKVLALDFDNPENNKAEVIANNDGKYSGILTIPSAVNYNGVDFAVTSIGENAFSFCSILASIIIPSSVISIDEQAFYYCEGLTSITIPNSVTSIGSSVFEGCSGLTEITIPNSVTSIGYRAFYYCSGLTSITIPNSVTSIGYGAFAVCSHLTEITIPNSVTSIGDWAFDYCSGLTEITIPNSVTSIGDGAFYECSSLTEITIPNSVTSIGYSAFSRCSGLTAFYGKYASTDNRCLIIDGSLIAFAPCGLTDYTIPNSVTSIGGSVFEGCSGLTSITIPNSVTSIGDGAFYYCSGLTSITFPNSVTSIGDGAFYYCSGLTAYYGKYASDDNRCLIIDGSLIAFAPCGLTDYTIPNSVTSIGSYVFSYYSGLTEVTIPNSVTSIGDGAFYYCSGLTEITIPNSVTSIGDWAFSYCSGLTEITIPNSVTSIGRYAFYNCSGLTEITCLVEDPSEIAMYSDVFREVPTATCTLYVPYGCKALYEAANQWKEFGNIVELGNPDVAEGYEVTIEDMVISPMDVTMVPVNLVNPDNITSMQFDIHLPDGLALATDEYGDYAIGKTSRLDNSFVIGSSDFEGAVRVIVYSSQVHSVMGNEGAIIELPIVLADQSAAEGDTFEVLLDNISVTMTEGFKEKFVADATATLTLGKRYTPGDVNNDGRYSAADVSMVVSYVLGMNPNDGIREAADVNEDGRISAADVSIVVYYVLTGRPAGSQSQSPLRPLKGELQGGCQPGEISEISQFSEYSEYSESSDISVNANGNLELGISGISSYTSAQFDIDLPEGVAVKNVSLRGSDGTGHSVAFSQADGTARVLVFSPLNRNFSADATFEIELDGSAHGNIDIDGIRLVEVAGNDITEASATGCTADFDISGLFAGLNRGIDIKATASGVVITTPEECDITIADTLGRTIRHQLLPGTNRLPLSSGVYFINNKKVIIK